MSVYSYIDVQQQCVHQNGRIPHMPLHHGEQNHTERTPSHACFRIRHDNKTIGSLEVKLQHVILQCNPEVLFYTRDASIITESAKRSHFAGSCSSDTCAHTSTRSYVPELHNTYEFLGISRCTSSWRSVGCGCLLPIPGCLFSRSFAKPRNEKVYEIFNCTTWEESAIMKYTYTGAKGKEETNIVRVEAQTTHEEEDGNITVEFIRSPNVPLSSTVFLRAVNSRSQETSIVDTNDVFALRCSTMDSARNLSLCHIEDTCFPTDTEANC
ncbi:hypothetical protein Y032_0889g2881 [Ancylostoma ceylanicum]|uniref:Phlebovirus glycoprotein G2 fusion domain-containing protein n=1 Tax=Ancylostoma ceylanicum TaxID=53326 RepID=A0A016WB62_9BILA|nr:hypothetical protein Y032_0889g2881 [Ancylostoma ceylanicum]